MSKNMAVVESNGLVSNVILCENDEPETPNLITYYDSNPAYIGGDYIDEYFYPKQPYPSWARDNGKWEAPTPYPTDGLTYSWNEAELAWQVMDFSETPAE